MSKKFLDQLPSLSGALSALTDYTLVRRNGRDYKVPPVELFSVKRAGAKGDGVTDDTEAIDAALAASLYVYFPPGDYVYTGSMALRDFQVLFGPAAWSQEATLQGAGMVARILFTGAGNACITQDDMASNLLHAGLSNLTIRCTGSYDWMMDLSTVIGLKMSNVLIGTTNLNTGGLRTAKIGGVGFSWANHYHNVHIRLPIGSTARALDTDTSDTSWVGGTLGGGQGAILRGTGGWRIMGAIINNATYGITISVETESLSQHQIVGCQIEENTLGGLLIDGDADDALAEDSVNFVVSGCQFRNPAAGKEVVFKNDTGPVLYGGVISGCMFTAPASTRIERNPARWKNVTVNGCTQQGPTTAQNNLVGGQFLGSPLVIAQSAVPASHTGNTNETALATITIPANSMGPGGRLRITTLWSHTNSVNNKFLRVRHNGTFNTNLTVTTTATTRAQTEIANRGATNSQVSHAAAGTGFGSGTGAIVTSAHDTTTDLNVVIAAQLANAGETVTLEGYVVELMPQD